MNTTQIEWTDATWNPVAGCSLASSGCKNCDAMYMARRLEAMGIAKYEGITQKRGKKVTWRGIVREDFGSLQIPYRWKKPRKIFVNSMSDLFHEDVSAAFIERVWQVMRDTPRHHYGKDDPAIGIGSGLSDTEAGLRLRYEIRREFARYIGVNWSRTYGETADFAAANSERTSDTQLTIGLRAWF